MIQEIKYAGITNSPSEYDCPDGDVARLQCGELQNMENIGSCIPLITKIILYKQ